MQSDSERSARDESQGEDPSGPADAVETLHGDDAPDEAELKLPTHPGDAPPTPQRE